jgi:hypothetical protein
MAGLPILLRPGPFPGTTKNQSKDWPLQITDLAPSSCSGGSLDPFFFLFVSSRRVFRSVPLPAPYARGSNATCPTCPEHGGGNRSGQFSSSALPRRPVYPEECGAALTPSDIDNHSYYRRRYEQHPQPDT